ncbi:hypothetical protein AVEN_156259-1 [Araneus ventricosus]|uniref:Uncharacterized protein n=1 Tax=Araneus ventricosus TaxID=182803 RepID=A0A4Y2ERJ0_ARAVE|nr:hypothetical protein AVEN_156259-1 [Araneus ventricosus]
MSNLLQACCKLKLLSGKMLLAIFEGDELCGVELNLVTGKGGLFYIIVYEILSVPKGNYDLNGVTTYTGDDLLRYELREDRKRETARNTGQIDSIKRDIIRSLRGNPIPQDIPSPMSSSGFMTPMEFDNLKQELVSCLREEMRMLLSREPHASQGTPVVNSQLYQTHLYTQL